MPKLPSLRLLRERTARVIRRFPTALFFALTGTVVATAEVELKFNQPVFENWCIRIIMTANIGLLLSLSADLLSESRLFSPLKKWGLRFAAILLSLAFLLLIDPAARSNGYTRFILLSFAFHLLVSFAAFSRHADILAFWQFNKSLFLRFLAGLLYAIVLFTGLSAAIASMNLLFGFDFEWDTFAILWVWIAGMFQTVFFLSGVPEVPPGDDLRTGAYPKGLKIFTQFVLIPLATVYVVILLAYELKILIQWNLPKGQVSNLILGYAVFGILSLLLIFPIREQDENKWMRSYSRSFYVLMLPLIALLVVAVLFRIIPYGITVPRYFLLALAAWLCFITLYFLFSSGRNIRIIPVSLCLLTLLTVYGPQSAFSVAEFSQVKTLRSLFKKYGAYDGKYLQRLDVTKIDSAGKERIRNVSQYVVSEFGLKSLQAVLKPDVQRVRDSILKRETDKRASRYSVLNGEQDWLEKTLNIPAYGGNIAKQVDQNHYVSNPETMLEPRGARYILPFAGDSSRVSAGGKSYLIIRHRDTNRFSVSEGENRSELNLAPMLGTLEKVKTPEKDETLANHFHADAKYFNASMPENAARFSLQFTNVNYTVRESRKQLIYVSGYLFVR